MSNIRENAYDLKDYFETNWLNTFVQYPNVETKHDTPPTKPYIIYDDVRLATQDTTLNQSARMDRGLIIFTVVDEVGGGTVRSDEVADQISELFVSSGRLELSKSTVTIIGHPFVEEGRRDGSDWKTRVLVNYRTE